MITRRTGVLLLITIAVSACTGQPIDCNLDALQADLRQMREKDQAIRKKLMPALAQYQEDGSGQLKLMNLAMKMQKQDATNQQRLQAIIEKCGWPEDLSRDAHETIFLVVQHSPDSLMRTYFPTVQAYADRGLLAPGDAATMYDRLQMRAGEPQRYGTQTFSDQQDRNLIWPVAEPEQLAARRDSVGLPSMDEYINLARDSSGIEMIWDTTITIEQARNMK